MGIVVNSILGNLAYTGVRAITPANLTVSKRSPTPGDYKGFAIGDQWLNTVGQLMFILVSVAASSATQGVQKAIWINVTALGEVLTLTGNAGGPQNAVGNNFNIVTNPLIGLQFTSSAGTVRLSSSDGNNLMKTLSGNDAVVVPASAGNNTRILGAAGQVNVTGDIPTNTLTISLVGGAGAAIETITTDDATVLHPVAGNIIIGGTNNQIVTTGAGHTATIALTPDVVIAEDLTIGGNFFMPNSTNAVGLIALNDVIYFSNFGPAHNNLFIGTAGNTTTTGSNNLAIGTDNTHITLHSVSTGTQNVALGFETLTALTTGNSNVAILSNSEITTGNSNILIIGGDNYTGAESRNIVINNAGVIGESAVIRIGNAADQNKCFIAGIAGVTTAVADAVPVLISASTGQLGTVSSSLKVKENIQDMGDYSSSIMDLRPVIFDYKVKSKVSFVGLPDHFNVGLIAEEVDDLMPSLVIYDQKNEPATVKYHDLVPMLLNELQKLSKRVKELEVLVAK